MSELQGSAIAVSAGLDLIHARTRGHPDVRIALLDGPVDLDHPALAGAAIRPLCSLVGAGGDAGRARSHGTRVASVLFGPAGGTVSTTSEANPLIGRFSLRFCSAVRGLVLKYNIGSTDQNR